jgi:hypothetical protein
MDATNNFVLDGSVTMVWGFEDEADEYAEAILERMPDLKAHVPSLWPLEVANALLVGERRRRITSAETARFIAILGSNSRSLKCHLSRFAHFDSDSLNRHHPDVEKDLR